MKIIKTKEIPFHEEKAFIKELDLKKHNDWIEFDYLQHQTKLTDWNQRIVNDILRSKGVHQIFGYFIQTNYGRDICLGTIWIRKNAPNAHVVHFMVDPACQHSGIGQKLIDYTINQLQAEDISALTLEVRINNTPAIRFYEKNQFENQMVKLRYYDSFNPLKYILSIKNIVRKTLYDSEHIYNTTDALEMKKIIPERK